MCAHNVTWGCSKLKSTNPGGFNAVSHVFVRQKLVPAAEVKVLPLGTNWEAVEKNLEPLTCLEILL